MNATVWSRRYVLVMLLVLIGLIGWTTIKPVTLEYIAYDWRLNEQNHS